ncbi:hypothetical protein FNT36_22490 [Hymenobacter setariae]|uniref:Tryptophan-rich sensory protein n=1 Tax=Hymenobacter setariae TaxID=2594794 RepID=A0A558BN38_9BACT|nr:tryptophan-rich sensory protein [Hymenobacter setariae]TVT37928.1 hypothetical protein FNT36_22490 [Hymenobacter setariae]
METSAPAGRLWRWLLPLAVVACLYVNYLYNAHPPAGAFSNGQMSARHPTCLTPAGYAFSIWGIIFSGLVIYTIWQLRPQAQRSLLPARLTPVLTLAVLATTAWTLVFSYELIGLSLGVMLTLLVLLAVAYARARKLVLAGAAPAWPTWFLSLYLGWILLATVLNIIFGLRDAFGWQWSDSATVEGCVQLAKVAGLIALILAVRARDLLLPLPVAWGLVGTWVAQRETIPPVAAVALTTAVLLLLLAPLGVWMWKKRRPKQAA